MLSTIPFLLIYPALMFLIGRLFLDALGLKKTIPDSFVSGFIASLALFHLIAYPFHLACGSFWALFGVYAFLLAGLTALSIYRIASGRDAEDIGKSLREFRKSAAAHRTALALLVLAVAALLAFSLLLRHDSSDDGYYISKSLETLETGLLNLNHSVYGSGYAFNDFKLTSDFTTFEYYRSFFSVLFGVHVSILSHTAMQLLYSIFSVLAVYSFAGRLFPAAAGKRFGYTTCFIAVTLFGNLGGNTGPFLAVRYGWHGKALLISVLAPVIMSICHDIISTDRDGAKIPAGLWGYCSVCLVAGICLSTVGIMLLPVLYVACGLPYILHSRWRIGKLFLSAFLSIIPVFLFGAAMYVSRLTDDRSLETAGNAFADGAAVKLFALTDTDISTWKSTFKWQMMSTGAVIPVLLAASLLYIMLKKGRSPEKFILGGSAIFILLTFLNPLLTDEVSSYLTTSTVYYRLYWILPVYYLSAYALCDLFSFISEKSTAFLARSGYKRRLVLTVAALCAAVFVGATFFAISRFAPSDYKDELMVRFAFSDSSSNAYRIPQTVIDISDYVLGSADDGDEPRVVCPVDIECYVRQYTSEIVIVTDNRHLRKNMSVFPGTDVAVCDLVSDFYAGSDSSAEKSDAIFRGFGVDYVLVPEGFELPADSALRPIKTFSGYSEYPDIVLYAY